jgi:hypothetical protein
MRAVELALFALATLAVAGPLRADVYLWTDEHGNVHMTDDLEYPL